MRRCFSEPFGGPHRNVFATPNAPEHLPDRPETVPTISGSKQSLLSPGTRHRGKRYHPDTFVKKRITRKAGAKCLFQAPRRILARVGQPRQTHPEPCQAM